MLLLQSKTLESHELADTLHKLADRARLIQLACDGMEDTEDAPLVGHEAYKLYLAIRDLSAQVHPTNVEEEIAFAKRQFDRKVKELAETEVA